jgi:hypothetical protein
MTWYLKRAFQIAGMKLAVGETCRFDAVLRTIREVLPEVGEGRLRICFV